MSFHFDMIKFVCWTKHIMPDTPCILPIHTRSAFSVFNAVYCYLYKGLILVSIKFILLNNLAYSWEMCIVQDRYNLTSNKLQQNGFQLKSILTIMECQQDQKVPIYLSRIFFYQHLKFQRIFNKNEKLWTNENSISLYFIYNYMDNNSNTGYLLHDTYLKTKKTKSDTFYSTS